MKKTSRKRAGLTLRQRIRRSLASTVVGLATPVAGRVTFVLDSPSVRRIKPETTSLSSPQVKSYPRNWVKIESPSFSSQKDLLPFLQATEIETKFAAVDGPSVESIDLSLVEQQVRISDTLFQPLQCPTILQKTKRGLEEVKEKQTGFLPTETGIEEKCIHGLKKSWCSFCSPRQQATKPTAWRIQSPDILDIIWILLQPSPPADFGGPLFLKPSQKLHDFQIQGAYFLIENERALLADEMGLGKSIQAIIAMRLLFGKGEVTQALIVCPKIVMTDWERKLWDWAPELTVFRIEGWREKREIAWEAGKHHIFLVTYETLSRDIENVDTEKFDLVLLDEAQKTKNPMAKMTRAVRKLNARRRWALTGTPLENSPDDVISLFGYLVPGLFHANIDYLPSHISKTIADYMLRRLKKDVLNLPDKVTSVRWLELSEAQREVYDRLAESGRADLLKKESIQKIHVFALINKLKQVCNFEPVSGESTKLDYIEDELGKLKETGDKALIFSQYPKVTLDPIVASKRLADFNPVVIDGRLSNKQRDEIKDKFQEEEENTIALISARSANLGITLTRANHVFHFDMWWNPTVASQAEDRAHRIGQEKPVYVHYLYTTGTVEERIYEILERKRELFQEVIDKCTDRVLHDRLTLDDLLNVVGLPGVKESQSAKGVEGTVAMRQAQEEITEQDMRDLSPYDFEVVVSRLFEKMGYHVKLTQYSRDGGIDIIAKSISQAGERDVAIQCKHYPYGVVGVEHVRSLYGVLSANQQYSEGFLVTSGNFSSDAHKFAENKRIELWNGDRLYMLLQKYNLLPFPA